MSLQPVEAAALWLVLAQEHRKVAPALLIDPIVRQARACPSGFVILGLDPSIQFMRHCMDPRVKHEDDKYGSLAFIDSR
jgi:hypothetical protein